MHSFMNILIQNNELLFSDNIISYNIIYYITINYYIIIIIVYDIKLSKMLLDFLLVLTNLHISLEAVEWRLVQVTLIYLG